MDTKKAPTQWRKFLSENFYQKGKASKLPKKGTDDYNTLIGNYNSWKTSSTPLAEAILSADPVIRGTSAPGVLSTPKSKPKRTYKKKLISI